MSLDSSSITSRSFSLTPEDNVALFHLCGAYNQHLKQIEQTIGVRLQNRGHQFQISGPAEKTHHAFQFLTELYQKIQTNTLLFTLDAQQLDTLLANEHREEKKSVDISTDESFELHTPNKIIQPYNAIQRSFLENIQKFDINFGIGPAGTGKTYLAVASAIVALENQTVERIVLVRPAVEAGEKLGFLPGDFSQKLDPYFRPLYDAIYEMIGVKQTMRYIETNIIEIAPLAYMRGRTLNNAFIILDEAQNTTRQQMKMFLTRIGFNTKIVVSGDVTQIDLPHGEQSGLKHCRPLLESIKTIKFIDFKEEDIVRHKLIKEILEAYRKNEI